MQHLGGSVIFVLALAFSTATAHVTCNPNTAPPGTYLTTNFQVPHGCGGSATKELRVQIGEGVSHVKPRVPQPNWTLTVEYRNNTADQVAALGENATVTKITWTAQSQSAYIPDSQYELFGITVKLPQKATGNAVYFPAEQVCVNSSSNWVYIPEAGKDVPKDSLPAPKVTLVNATATTTPATTAVSGAHHLRIETILFAVLAASAAFITF